MQNLDLGSLQNIRRMRNSVKRQLSLLLFFFLQSLTHDFAMAGNRITRGESLRDGDDHEPLVSPDKIFELGFFSLGTSTSRYLGIRYGNIEDKAVVWIANRAKPISDKSGVLTLGNDGNLVLSDGNNSVVWSSGTKIESSSNTEAVLRDSGNFLLSETGKSKVYWQSFDHPTDTFLPEMRVKVNQRMGENRAFVSWKSSDDPSPGNFTMGVDPSGAPEIVVWEGNGTRKWRSGQWNSAIFTGIPNMAASTNYLYGFKLSSPPDENGSVDFTYVPSDRSVLLRFRVLPNGTEQELRWDADIKKWTIFQSEPDFECDEYNRCGNFGICNMKNAEICSCIKGYEPVSPGDWSKGCRRRTELKCQSQRTNASTVLEGQKDEFFTLKTVKLPDFERVLASTDSDKCKEKCLEDCSCNAYVFANGIGCMVWNGSLVDVQQFTNGGASLHIRLDGSELGTNHVSSLVIIIPVVVGVILLGGILLFLCRFRRRKATSASACCQNNDVSAVDVTRSKGSSAAAISGSIDIVIEGKPVNTSELPVFSLSTVSAATYNFCRENELGRGGFGPVYKGVLQDGQEIAVKRLSGKSGQGDEEFKNEIILIAKLQHRNLVRLLGCCFEGEEKMLVYEYMPNKSLDFFLFNESKRALLDWKLRFSIVEGIARGLLYLHRDSRLRIIHRDMKASNVLLDAEMNPKISDFGMARIFGGNQNEANTVRVVGTYGYMSPEYAMEGLFSVKSDVYSFGVLLLEIVSGKRNTSFRSSEHGSLINYVSSSENKNQRFW
ncbi:PREDICTED: G-type lectin S-receptor-like serine/threonine-protein kinase B120 isoform X2 [Tarenaya hassleriana]|uniref:G-type lectin S-receptor-like serine/threonine-protein kinase B120 isoform X2 n=1 Tax=Tarenaya hassleriana TaxID=28532 RepID=UPI00053C2F88|nr:PREDICTED: G-type lectin S-receptor-like serine/threonine-protein kinase B120 isoform X2 [Tarenaya hassleriana]